MLNYTDLEMNLHAFDTSEGTVYCLSAYGMDEFNELDTSNFISVEIAESDYRCFTDEDDYWSGDGETDYKALLATFILYQLNKKVESK